MVQCSPVIKHILVLVCLIAFVIAVHPAAGFHYYRIGICFVITVLWLLLDDWTAKLVASSERRTVPRGIAQWQRKKQNKED